MLMEVIKVEISMFQHWKNHMGNILLVSFVSLVMIALLLIGQQSLSIENPPQENPPNQDAVSPTEDVHQNKLTLDQEEKGEKESSTSDQVVLPIHQVEDAFWLNIQELIEITEGTYEWDEVNKVLRLEVFGIPFVWIKDVPVIERNGIFLPVDSSFLVEGDDFFLPLDFITVGLELESHTDKEHEQVLLTIDQETETVFSNFSQKDVQLEELSLEELIEHLSFLSNPIPKAQISVRDSHLPGARRAYRNGYHEGIDWYSGTSGRGIDLNTPALSVADGVVVRTDLDYVEMGREEREDYLTLSGQLGNTPAYILDKLRGRSVWVQYDQGVMVRYVHLSRVAEGLKIGQEVKRGDTLGYVGNSGTSYAINGDVQGGLHLHADLLLYGELFWQYIDDPSKVRYVLEHVLQD